MGLFNIPKLVRSNINKILDYKAKELNCSTDSIDVIINKKNNTVFMFLYKDKEFIQEIKDTDLETILN